MRLSLYAFILAMGSISPAVHASSPEKIEQNPLCPKELTEEIANQIKGGTYPGISIDGGMHGVRHGRPGFKWDPGLVLVQGDLRAFVMPGDSVESVKNTCLFVEARSPDANFILFKIQAK